jgi:hypothetical protein
MHLTRTPLNPLYIPILTFIRTTDPFFIVAPPADPFNLLIAFHAHITHCKAIVDCVAPRTGFVPALGNAGNPGSRLATSAAEAGFKHGQTREVEGRSEGERSVTVGLSLREEKQCKGVIKCMALVGLDGTLVVCRNMV